MALRTASLSIDSRNDRWLVTLVGFAATISGGIDVADREHPMAFG